MKKTPSNMDIENWVLGLTDRVKKNEPVEDSREELKAIWVTDHAKTARQLAGMANAARGEFILWVIGLDETRGVLGAAQQELANWWPQVQSHFDGIAPTFIDLNVPVTDAAGQPKTVVALLFFTDRAPYVVKDGPDAFDVPWRVGKKTKSADRSELIKLLVPVQHMPEVEIVSAQLHVTRHDDNKGKFYEWTIDTTLLVSPAPYQIATFRLSRTTCKVESATQLPPTVFTPHQICTPDVVFDELSKHVCNIEEPGILAIRAYARGLPDHGPITESMTVTIELTPERVERSVTHTATLTLHTGKNYSGAEKSWSLGPWDGGWAELMKK